MKIVIIISGLLLMGCSTTPESLTGKHLFTFSKVSTTFFPDVIQDRIDTSAMEHFNSDHYTEILKRLGEESLSDKYEGKEVFRLTAIKSFSNPFTIRIERDGNKITITEKEAYKTNLKATTNDSTKTIITEHLEFDTARNEYVVVKISNQFVKGTINELDRTKINPIIKDKTETLGTKKWNEILRLVNEMEFFNMRTQLGMTGDDGTHYLIETHSNDGYYVVDRWSPKNGDFKDLVDYIIALTDRDAEN
jgi:hypothetical protein